MTPRQTFLEDFAPYASSHWPWLAGLVVVGLMVLLVRRTFLPTLANAADERAVNRVLRRRLHSSEYRVMGNLLLPDGKGGFTQVDHVVLSIYGVFVIETKVWSGGVFGTHDDRQWTLGFSSGRRRALNPLIQNAKHVRVVGTLLNIDLEHCHNLVFITCGATLKKGPVIGVFQKGLIAHIRSFRDPVMTEDDVTASLETLQESSLWNDPTARAAHRRQVRSRRKVRGIE